MNPADSAITKSELLGGPGEQSTGLQSISAGIWSRTGDMAQRALNTATEHPVETAVAAAATAAVVYLGARRMLGRPSSAQVAALAEKAEVQLGAFRARIMHPSPSVVSEIEALPDLLPKQVANVEVVGNLGFLPSVKGFGVGQATYAIAKAEVPLATRGLSTCGALVVQNERTGMHYLAHLDSGVAPSQIRSSLSSFNLAESNIYLMKGPNNYKIDASVVEALSTTPGALQRLKFVQGAVDDTGVCHGIASFKGGLHRYSPQMKSWPEFNTGIPSRREMRALVFVTGSSR